MKEKMNRTCLIVSVSDDDHAIRHIFKFEHALICQKMDFIQSLDRQHQGARTDEYIFFPLISSLPTQMVSSMKRHFSVVEI